MQFAIQSIAIFPKLRVRLSWKSSSKSILSPLRIERLDRDILTCVKEDEAAQRLTTVPGVRPIIAATVRAAVQDAHGFRTGRDFAAWTGSAPRALSSGGKERLGSISKRGNRQLQNASDCRSNVRSETRRFAA